MDSPASSSSAPEASHPPDASAAPAVQVDDTITVITAQGKRQQQRRENVRPHDFRQSAFLAPSELRRIRLRHEQFVRALAARLSIYLRMECAVRINRLQVVGYQAFTESLPNPTHIILFKADPLRGVCLLAIPPRIGLSIVERLLGGAGQAAEGSRDLSEIETALLDQAAQIILTEWCIHWQDLRELHPALIGHENNGRFLQTAPPDTAMLSLTMEVTLGEIQEQVQMVFPYFMLEPLIRLLVPAAASDNDGAPAATPKLKWNPELNEVEVPVTAEWTDLVVTAREIMQLKTGDVLLLGPQCAGQIQVLLARVPKFFGRLGTCGSKWAVELTGAVQP